MRRKKGKQTTDRDIVRVSKLTAGLVLFVLLFFCVLLWSIAREPTASLRVTDPGELHALLPSLVGLTQSSLEPGNSVRVLQNGDEFFPALLQDIAAASETIHFETFIWQDGAVATALTKALVAKARAGVEVRVLVDASGGRDLDDEELEALRKAGARVAHFHPVRISNLGRINNRDHRKLAIVDGRIGYIGGFGVADEWSGNAGNRKRYRDTGLRVTGPIVNRFQAAFAENWIEETGEIPAGERYFPHLEPTGEIPAHLAYTSPTGSVSSLQILHYLAIRAARREILIQNPYLLPEDAAVEALADAVKRGVRVRIMVPSDDATDMPVAQHASHRDFERLLRHGIELWEYEKTLLHQKVMVVDGVWACVGSTNFDDRSFQLNDEVSLGILDRATAAQLRAAFADDLRHARRRRLEEWTQRSIWHKALDRIAYLGRSQL